MKNWLLASIEKKPSIAGIKDDAGLQLVLKTDCKIVFVLYGKTARWCSSMWT